MLFFNSCTVFTMTHHAMAVYAVVVCLSVTSPCSTKTAKRRIMQTMQFSDAEDLSKTQTGSPPMEVPNAGGGRLKFATFDKSLAITRKRRPSQALLTYFVRRFITLSVHLCLQHVCHDAVHCVGLSATADTCYRYVQTSVVDLFVVVYWHVNIVCCRRHLICVATVGVATSAWVDIEQWRDSFVSTCAVYWRLGADWIVWGTAKRDCYSWWVTVIPSSMHSRSRRPVDSVSSLASGLRW